MVFRDGHHVVALLLELLPTDTAGKIARIEDALDPVELAVTALRVFLLETETLGQKSEDLVIGLGLAQRLDALLLQDDETVVDLVELVGAVA
jgi:hypothetical protein